MKLSERHLQSLERAESHLVCCDFCPYLDLKALFTARPADWEGRFQVLFKRFYRMNQAHLGEEFESKYFEILTTATIKPTFESVFEQLYGIARLKGDCPPQFSFVSKLVGIHDESSPLYDRHVKAFFNIHMPRPGKADRVAQFIVEMRKVRASYDQWSEVPRVMTVLEKMKAGHPALETCHHVRLLDFLVWKAGREKL